MNEFAWALAAFVLIHVGISATGLRTVLVRAIGEGPYRGLFALVSLALIIWLVRGFARMRADPFDQGVQLVARGAWDVGGLYAHTCDERRM